MTDHPRLDDLHAAETLDDITAVLAVDVEDLAAWLGTQLEERIRATGPIELTPGAKRRAHIAARKQAEETGHGE